MKLLPSQVGAEPKKVAILGAIVVVAGIVYWANRTAAPEALASVTTKTVADPVALKNLPEVATRPVAPVRDTSPMPAKRTSKGGAAASTGEDFRPTLKPKDGVDVTRIDPTLHLELLAKVREVPMEGGSRNLFEFGQAAAPPTPKVGPIVVPLPAVTKVVPPPAPTKPAEPSPPPAPPIPSEILRHRGNHQGRPPARVVPGGRPRHGKHLHCLGE